MRRLNRIFVLVAAIAVMVTGLAATPALASPESSFVSKINAERSARGLGKLQVNGDLAAAAEKHSGRMMDKGSLYHNPNLGSVTSGWEALGENVGVGSSVDRIHQLFMESSGHRGNILGDYDSVGVGVKQESENKLWVTVIFMRSKTVTTTTTTTTQAPTTTTQAPATTTTAAPAPTTQPPSTQPPSTQPPSTQPPSTQPPSTQPPSTRPPATQPPSTSPPTTVGAAPSPVQVPAQSAASPPAPPMASAPGILPIAH